MRLSRRIAKLWQKVIGLFNYRPPYCKKCEREETRPEWIEKWQCSFCFGPLVKGQDRYQK